ncbi:MAG: MATE family efflux transporter, partial [Christensenellaceae bacterium]
FSIVGVLRSGGDTTVAAAIDLGSVWLIALPMALLGALVLKLPGHIVFIMITVADVVKSALSLWRIRTRKWMNTLTAAQ